MAQKTSWTGAALSQTDINTYLMGEGGAWTSFTPTLTQSGTVTNTATWCKYGRWGRLIVANFYVTVTGTGTASNVITIGLPVTAATSSVAFGSGYIYDNSTGIYYPGIAYLASGTTASLIDATQSSTTPTLGAAGFTAALAANDIVNLTLTYEAAS